MSGTDSIESGRPISTGDRLPAYLPLGNHRPRTVISPHAIETVLVFHRRPDKGQPVEMDSKKLPEEKTGVNHDCHHNSNTLH